jgi:hypothetical protein
MLVFGVRVLEVFKVSDAPLDTFVGLLTCVGEALSLGKLMGPGRSCSVEGLEGVGGSLLPWPRRPPSIGWLCWTLAWWAADCCIGIPTTAPAVKPSTLLVATSVDTQTYR